MGLGFLAADVDPKLHGSGPCWVRVFSGLTFSRALGLGFCYYLITTSAPAPCGYGSPSSFLCVSLSFAVSFICYCFTMALLRAFFLSVFRSLLLSSSLYICLSFALSFFLFLSFFIVLWLSFFLSFVLSVFRSFCLRSFPLCFHA